MNKATEFLKGKKTYYLALLAILYCGGAWLGFYELDEKVLIAFGFGSIATLRHGLKNALKHVVEESAKADAKDEAASGPKSYLPLLFLLAIPILSGGCVLQRAVAVNPETKAVTKYTGVAWFNNTAIKGLNVGKTTKTTSNLFSLEEGSNEVNTEALKAVAEGATRGALKSVAP